MACTCTCTVRSWDNIAVLQPIHSYSHIVHIHTYLQLAAARWPAGSAQHLYWFSCLEDRCHLWPHDLSFALAQVNFPPNIYYKVFTNRPVVDLCAYSPRDYTAMAHRHRLPRDVHNKGPREVEEGNKSQPFLSIFQCIWFFLWSLAEHAYIWSMPVRISLTVYYSQFCCNCC